MINKIIASYILFACLIAIALKLAGVDEAIHFGSYFRAYIVQTNLDLQDFKIAIPQIPEISHVNFGSVDFADGWDVWEVVRWYLKLDTGINTIINILNGFVRVLNVVIIAANTIIEVLELIFIFLKNIIVMRDTIITA